MASELKVDKFTGITTAGSILVTGEGIVQQLICNKGCVKFGFVLMAQAQFHYWIVLTQQVSQMRQQENTHLQ